jgi:hypothetical protein
MDIREGSIVKKASNPVFDCKEEMALSAGSAFGKYAQHSSRLTLFYRRG